MNSTDLFHTVCKTCGEQIEYNAALGAFCHKGSDRICNIPANHPNFMFATAEPKEN